MWLKGRVGRSGFFRGATWARQARGHHCTWPAIGDELWSIWDPRYFSRVLFHHLCPVEGKGEPDICLTEWSSVLCTFFSFFHTDLDLNLVASSCLPRRQPALSPSLLLCCVDVGDSLAQGLVIMLLGQLPWQVASFFQCYFPLFTRRL